MTYFGNDERPTGMPEPWYHYMVVASSGHKPDSGIASIVSLSEARAQGIASGTSHTILAKTGGEAEAIKQAEMFLDKEHAGLNKRISNVK